MRIRGLFSRILAVVAGLLAVTDGSAATSILYWTDYAVGSDAMAGALATIGNHGDFAVTTATGDEDFAARIATGDYQLGILFVQLDASGYASVDALADFTDAGGWAMYADFSGNNVNAARFGFQFTGNNNLSEVTIADPSLNEPVSLEEPIFLMSPGWTDYSFGLAVEGQGTVLATFENGDAAAVRTLSGGRAIAFGMLNDTFTDYEQGVDFYTNAIVAIPEPATFAFLLCAGALLLVGFRRWKVVR